jgi:hypothetical protein
MITRWPCRVPSRPTSKITTYGWSTSPRPLLEILVMSTSDQTQSGIDTSRDALPSYRRLTTVAGLTIIIAGVWHILQGVAALAGDGRFVSPPNYIYKFELTGWSWIYLLLGTFAVAVGFAVFTGQVWGRVAGILLNVLAFSLGSGVGGSGSGGVG